MCEVLRDMVDNAYGIIEPAIERRVMEYKIHPNGKGRVYDSAKVDASSYIGENAQVSGNAQVYGNAQVSGDAQVYGNAQVSGNARVSGDALVSGDAKVYGLMRSDGFCFTYVLCKDGRHRIIAGCRYFTMGAARRHWKKTRFGTPLGNETLAILDYFETVIKYRKEA